MTLYQRYKRLNVWNKLGVIASITGILAFIIAVITLPIFERANQRPHFEASLQIGDSPTDVVLLTNDFLFDWHFENTSNLPNGAFVFKGIAKGCVVIPVQYGESNKVFNFIIENDSAIKVIDLEVAVGFPKDWKCGLDSAKWHGVGQHFIVPGWKLEITNLQYWAAQSPWPVFPSDTLNFPPITNASIPTYNGPSINEGLFELNIRSTDFQNMLVANILFVPVSSNFFKPFVTSQHRGTDGFYRLSISQKEFENLQK